MDMYQKRKIRKENKKSSQNNELEKIVVNWYIPTNVKPLTNMYK